MGIREDLNGQILWNSISDANPINHRLGVIHTCYKHKFQLIGEELIEKANKCGKECTIEINIRYKNLEGTC